MSLSFQLAPEPPLQRSLKTAIGCVGVGLHSGVKSALSLRPAPADTGIVFVREDLPGTAPIPATVGHVADTTRCTQLKGADGAAVNTVEHVMAALAAWGIDNAIITVAGPEVPALDGSARDFGFLIGCAGVVEQDQPRRFVEVLKPVTVHHGDRWARLVPHAAFAVDMTIDFDHPLIGVQHIALPRVDLASFNRELAAARTFGFAEDVVDLRAKGLALGGSLDNAVVVAHDHVLNPGGLRWPDEFVRHKALDAVGDLYLAGPLLGRVEAKGSGHMLHVKLLRELFADPAAWRYADFPEAAATVTRSLPVMAQQGAD
ncbi:MAG: UDP-3-O-[3-hydroxymyristoyl] N-acetylglucosamine deacetylase [Geminicoccaceae bacterium]|nr:MAG: UDP-3-O-[3-hydroxymyristoyl] N-acetylglucosamine deacetylase [Geminicoccaceae bacterium]